MNKSIWLPHLIVQRGLGVKDLREVNFTATLIEHGFGGVPKMWSPKENKPDLLTQTQSLSGPNLDASTIGLLDTVEDRLKRGVHHSQTMDRGSRPDGLVEEVTEYDRKTRTSLIKSIPLRGEPVHFKLLGYDTWLFQNEYDLIKDIVDRIQEIYIYTTYGLSPLFKVVAKLKD